MKPKSKKPLLLIKGGYEWKIIVHSRYSFLIFGNGGRMMKKDVTKKIAKEIEKDMKGGICNKIFFKLFKKKIIKIYKLGITYGFNNK